MVDGGLGSGGAAGLIVHLGTSGGAAHVRNGWVKQVMRKCTHACHATKVGEVLLVRTWSLPACSGLPRSAWWKHELQANTVGDLLIKWRHQQALQALTEITRTRRRTAQLHACITHTMERPRIPSSDHIPLQHCVGKGEIGTYGREGDGGGEGEKGGGGG